MAADRFRYGAWSGGPDPLAPPFDVRRAVEQLGESVLAGHSPAEALRELSRRGAGPHAGLDELRRRVRDRQRAARRAGRLDGTLGEVRELLDRALAEERRALFPDPSDDARLAEAELDGLPRDTARAVRALADYPWRSPRAREAYEQIDELLRREVLDSQFRGIRDALSDPGAMARAREMLADLNALLEADDRGEDVRERFEQFLDRHGEFFPDRPADLDELVDSLARRAAAGARLMNSLTPQQRDELAGLMAGAMAGSGLAEELGRLGDALRARRPGLDWSGQTRMRGDTPLGLGEATTALEEVADLAELAAALAQDYPGAALADIDPELVERTLGSAAAADAELLRRVERELEEQGYLVRERGELTLSPKAVRRIGAAALRRVFADVAARGRGGHDVRDAGAAGEPTGASRPWRFGDEQPLDVVRTLRNAVLRTGPGRLRLAVDDFEVVDTERRARAAVVLLVDLSLSMWLNDTWGPAKTTALALHSLVSTRYPQDALLLVGFNAFARRLTPEELAGLSAPDSQGTNLQHALALAGRHLARHPGAEPVVMVVTDGEPTAHLDPGGRPVFSWPTSAQTEAATLAEVDALTRLGATINVFLLSDAPELVAFVDGVARRNGGRVFAPAPERLGEYVVSDYLRSRRGRRARRGA